MNISQSFKRLLVAGALAGYMSFVVLGIYVFFHEGILPSRQIKDSAPLIVPPTILSTFEKKALPSQLPVRLKIPTLQVDAGFEYVGLTPEGAVDIPKGPTNVAWFNQSPPPGDNGSSVIVGHFGWHDSIPAVFDDLDSLQPGDKLSVEGEKGAVTNFIVHELRSYDAHEVVPDVFSSSDDKAHLNLITCQGTWNNGQQSYSKRLVVFSDKE